MRTLLFIKIASHQYDCILQNTIKSHCSGWGEYLQISFMPPAFVLELFNRSEIIAVSGIKIENKLGLSWAKLSHLNSIELRSTAFSILSCSWKSQTELVCYKNVYFSTSEVQEGRCKKDSHCRLEHICDFYQPS